jgi:hypothetical protein
MEQAMLGTILSMSDTQAGTYKRLYGMSDVPDMSADADKIEVTNLSDTNKRSIPGIVDYGDPEFGFFNDNSATETDITMLRNAYKALRTREISKIAPWFKLIYPDGTGFGWQAYVITTRTGGGTGDALKFNAKMLIISNIADIPGIGGLTFTCVAGLVSGATKISSVAPVLTSGNSYIYLVGLNLQLPSAGAAVSGAPYTLGADIVAAAAQSVMLIEVDASWHAVNAGIAISVPKS